MDYNDVNDYEIIPPNTPINTNDNNYFGYNIKIDKEKNNSINLRLYAKAIIVRAWKRYLNRKTFQILKNSLYEIEKIWDDEILRKLNPRESVLFNDPLSRGKIRFRFGGEIFPPYIYYKIYSNGQNVQYFSGYKIINSFSNAYHDAYKLMGKRNFEKIINKDNVWNNNCDISEPYNVTNKKEYVQYLNSLDKKPIYLGGRNNGWRELSTLSVFIPLYEKEICNIYEKTKKLYSSISRNNLIIANNKIINKKVTNSTLKKVDDLNIKKINYKINNERKKMKLVSKKKSNIEKHKKRIKKMQKMYQQAKHENSENYTEFKNKNIDKENIEEESSDNDVNSSNYDSTDDSTEYNEDNISTEGDINIDDIENDDFHNIYEWTSELSFENSFNDNIANLKI